MTAETDRTGVRGILAPAVSLDGWLLVLLVATCAVRYVARHGLGTDAAWILLGAVVLASSSWTRSVCAGRSWWPALHVGAMVLVWTALTLVAPSFSWCAVPVAFAVLRVVPFVWAVGTVVGMTLVVAAATLRITTFWDPTLAVGPVGIALVTVIAYRALEREAQTRQVLLDELTQAQAELSEEQRRSGALAERTRLSREIHDSVGQGLSSINLLLNAAQQAWVGDPKAARAHVATAAATAREGLHEVRRVVQDLAPPDLVDDPLAEKLPAALRREVDQVAATMASGLEAEVRVHGAPAAVPQEVSAALVRTARGALANVREHAGATRVVVTLTYHPDEVLLDVRDDGIGFAEAARSAPPGLRGHGLRGIRERMVELGGHVEVESAPGEGTTVSVHFPLRVS